MSTTRARFTQIIAVFLTSILALALVSCSDESSNYHASEEEMCVASSYAIYFQDDKREPLATKLVSFRDGETELFSEGWSEEDYETCAHLGINNETFVYTRTPLVDAELHTDDGVFKDATRLLISADYTSHEDDMVALLKAYNAIVEDTP
ncbi:MAG: hypothetical protein ACTJG2_00630 [Candidatus Saccharimonadales bacterium]